MDKYMKMTVFIDYWPIKGGIFRRHMKLPEGIAIVSWDVSDTTTKTVRIDEWQ